jgi:transposase
MRQRLEGAWLFSATMKTMTLQRESTVSSSTCLLLAFELGERRWKLGFSVGIGQRPRVRDLAAGAVARLDDEIRRAKQRFGVPSEAPVISCYEAGREGFWLHRYLVAHGITSHVVDSSSIEVSRRARRAKTDRLDLGGLLTLLARFVQGERRLWRVVRVPSVTEEDARHLPRTIEAVTQHRPRPINRVKGLLATHGVRCRVDADFLRTIHEGRLWDGTPLPPGLDERLRCEWAQLEHLAQQLRGLKSGAHETPARPHHDARPDDDATAARPRRRPHERDGADRRSLCLATDPESSPVGRLGCAHARPLSKWRDAAGSGPQTADCALALS